MEPELQQQYASMISSVISDDTDAAKAVLSNIMSAKLASQLQAHNANMMVLNRTPGLPAANETPPTV